MYAVRCRGFNGTQYFVVNASSAQEAEEIARKESPLHAPVCDAFFLVLSKEKKVLWNSWDLSDREER